ncbi:MAG: hypothetical protein E5X67_03250 [Mesorhizobium sp.]|uniref:hypothetical protein n=1 Tax=Mesorhizobium sp. TaxID=1871066 RepID=UPI00121D817E|nr:hypothetical protein [Mesorhizobium sp.]TIP30109.1 MAG: hypothetical protein E5X67_03250 [Mesorhizobium sp.]
MLGVSKLHPALSGYRRDAGFEAIGPLDWFVLFPLFVVIATQLEISDDPSAGGVAFFIRSLAALTFLCVMILRFGISVFHRNIAIVSAFLLYFYFVNIVDFSRFSLMALAFMSWGLAFGVVTQAAWRERLEFLLRAYLVFNVAGLVLALAILLLSGQIVDLHGMVFPFSASRAGVMMNQVRLSGFQIEPGNYSNAVYVLVLIRCLFRRRIANLLDLFAVLSTLSTLAAWAVVGAVVYLVCFAIEFTILNRQVPKILRVAIVLFSVSLLSMAIPLVAPQFFGSQYVEYFSDRFRFEEGKGSGYYKDQAFRAWQDSLGDGMLIGSPLPATFCDYCVSPQDLGLVFNMFFYIGIIPTLLILLVSFMQIFRIWGTIFVLLFCPFLVIKFFFYDPMVWLTFGVIIFERRRYEYVGRMKYG